MSGSSNRLRLASRALGFAALLIAGASATLGQGLYYKEIEKDGRIYVFNNAATVERFEAGGDLGPAITRLGAGPNGETIVADNERALQLYYFKHGISEPVPEPPPPPPPAPPPYKFSGLMFGDYYYFDQDHLPAFDSQQGFWFRRMYFTFEYTISPKLSTRLRFETNSNGKLQGGVITPFVKDAWLKWNVHGPQQLTLGIQSAISFDDYVEPFWGLRHIEKTPIDLYRWDSSRDFGVALAGPINQKHTFKYAVQFGNDAGTNSETDKFKGYRAALRYVPDHGFNASVMVMDQQRPRDGDRATEQIFLAYKGKEWGRVAVEYDHQDRNQISSSPLPDFDLDIYSAFAIFDIVSKKWSVFARWDRYDDPCGADCTAIDYLPIDPNEPFDFYLAGFEWYLHPQVRFSPNVEVVSYHDAPAPLPQPKDDKVARLTFYWNF